ncbi:hypothetical protein V2G26_016799 [Clonostachys chloroleuca]
MRQTALELIPNPFSAAAFLCPWQIFESLNIGMLSFATSIGAFPSRHFPFFFVPSFIVFKFWDQSLSFLLPYSASRPRIWLISGSDSGTCSTQPGVIMHGSGGFRDFPNVSLTQTCSFKNLLSSPASIYKQDGPLSFSLQDW